MANAPAYVAALMASQGRCVPVHLLEIQTALGQRFYFSDMAISALSAMGVFDVGGAAVVDFLPRIVESPTFELTGTLATSTGRVTLENLSGNTVQRNGAMMLAANVFSGALFIHRVWLPDAEYALLTFNGDIIEPEALDETIQLTLRDRMNFSAAKAPSDKINENCQLTFGSMQCGSTSPTPCQNSWGSCTQKNRFKGWINQWAAPSTVAPSYAQPLQIAEANLRRPS